MQKISKGSSVLHVSDRPNEPSPNSTDYDKLYKIHPMFNLVQDSLLKATSLNKIKKIDEGMIAFKSGLGYVQYLPAKSIKKGTKVWMHCDACTAYLHQFEVYLG